MNSAGANMGAACPSTVVRALGAAALLAAGLLAASLASAGQAASNPAAPAVTQVVAYRDMLDVISAEGVVEAVRQSTVAAQVAGQIVELKVKVGDRVQSGQVLARIDARTAQQAVSSSRSLLAEAQAGLTNAVRAHERARQLFAQRFISKAALDQAELDYRAAEARVAALQANAAMAATASTLTTITAPFAGVVAATTVEVGDMAMPGRALVTVFDPAAMRVVATLSQASLGEIKLDRPIRVELPELKRSMTAKQVTLVPLADSRTHTARLRLELGESAGLLPGQFARVYFASGVARKLAIPASAVLRRSEVTAAYVIDARGQAQLRQIRTGDVGADGDVEVLAGLREGERVALDPVRSGLSLAGGAAPHGALPGKDR